MEMHLMDKHLVYLIYIFAINHIVFSVFHKISQMDTP